VAGTIAAQDNGNGVVGVAPDVSLYIVRVFGASGSAPVSVILAGMQACGAANVNIISMSLGWSVVSRVSFPCFYTLDRLRIIPH
jgi:subtilisin family serine protease